jgi:iron(III) transport system substrate-binding protein
MKTSGLRVVAMIAAVALSIAACGSSDEPSASDDTEEAPASSEGDEESSASSDGDEEPSEAGDDNQSLDELVEAAQGEGQLTLYGDVGEPTLQAWTQAFTEEYGIAVNILRLPESELFQRLSQEKSAGQNLVDIYSTINRVSMDQAVDNEWMAEYTPENGEQYPAEHREDGFYYPVQNGYFMTVAYNSDVLSDEDIALLQEDAIGAAGDPRFRGQVQVGPPQASQHAAAFYYLQTEEQSNWDRLQAIADNDAIVQAQSIPLVQNVVSGEYAIGIAASDTLVAQQVTAGAPIEFVYPVNTTGGYIATGVVDDAPQPNAARLFMEWATTPEANAIYSEITQTTPTNDQVSDDREITELDFYEEPGEVWVDWIFDETFIEASSAEGDFFDQWNDVFGYSG